MYFKKWVLSKVDKEQAKALAEACGVDPMLALIALSRGQKDPFALEAFLSDEVMMEDPFLLADMDRAVARIRQALQDRQKICVYGDYDCDGVTATAILYSYLKERGANVAYFIPSRTEDGYGMHKEAVSRLKADGTSLIITVDNGVAAVDEIAYAASLGIDVVVTDHHLPTDRLPSAAAVVDPHRADCPSGFKDLAGVGVAFKLICALDDCLPEELLDKYADYVALGTVADMMPLTEENRCIVKIGLQKLAGSSHCGVAALLQKASVTKRPLTAGSISYQLAPRINASGRVGHADTALKLLLCDASQQALAFELAEQLNAENVERQKMEKLIFEQACEQIESYGYALDRVIVVSSENWHMGVVGIVASKLVERYGRPCILLCREGDTARGSGRSLGRFSLYDCIAYAGTLVTKFGGHALAAGLTLPSAEIDAFREQVNQYAATLPQPAAELKLDCKLNPAAVSLDMVHTLQALQPFGLGNPTPLFGLYRMRILKITPIGGGRHLRLQVFRDGVVLDALLFGVTPQAFAFLVDNVVDLAVTLDVNTYGNREQLAIQIRDIRISDRDDERLLEQLHLYEAFRRGEALEDMGALTPSRSELAEIYRFIRNRETSRRDMILQQLSVRIPVGKIMIGLDAFCEVGLLQMNQTEGEVIYCVKDQSQKVDLTASNTLRILQAERGQAG